MKTATWTRLAIVMAALSAIGTQGACGWFCASPFLVLLPSARSVDPGEAVSFVWDDSDTYECTVFAEGTSGRVYTLVTARDHYAFDTPTEDTSYSLLCDSDCGEVFGYATVDVIEPAEE